MGAEELGTTDPLSRDKDFAESRRHIAAGPRHSPSARSDTFFFEKRSAAQLVVDAKRAERAAQRGKAPFVTDLWP